MQIRAVETYVAITNELKICLRLSDGSARTYVVLEKSQVGFGRTFVMLEGSVSYKAETEQHIIDYSENRQILWGYVFPKLFASFIAIVLLKWLKVGWFNTNSVNEMLQIYWKY